MITLDSMPCSNDPAARCTTCELHGGNGCPVEIQLKYSALKVVYPAINEQVIEDYESTKSKDQFLSPACADGRKHSAKLR